MRRGSQLVHNPCRIRVFKAENEKVAFRSEQTKRSWGEFHGTNAHGQVFPGPCNPADKALASAPSSGAPSESQIKPFFSGLHGPASKNFRASSGSSNSRLCLPKENGLAENLSITDGMDMCYAGLQATCASVSVITG